MDSRDSGPGFRDFSKSRKPGLVFGIFARIWGSMKLLEPELQKAQPGLLKILLNYYCRNRSSGYLL